MHIWLVALVLAACAPWCVRFVADALERASKRRTEALVTRAGAGHAGSSASALTAEGDDSLDG